MLNVAMLSRWHVHADGYAETLKKTGKVNITAVWDENPSEGKKWAEKLGAEFTGDLDALLARKDVDAVVCCTPTTMHREVLIKAANAGKHIFSEKAMATTVEDCVAIADAVKKNGVIFMLSLPHKCRSDVMFIKRCIDNGDFGDITLARVRNAHNGISGKWLPSYWFDESAAGGGAMMDLGCHPMYLLSMFLGKPKNYAAIYSSPFGTAVDENAAALIEFENGATGVSETSFVSYASPYIIEIHGTKGVLISTDGKVLFRNEKTAEYQNGFISPTLPPARPDPIAMFPDVCLSGGPAPEEFGLDAGIELTRLLEETYKVNASK
jgi:predicted dehydrogenase